MSTPLLELSAIEKHFGGVTALRHASLEVRAGEVHGLVGENGAGKSTLINIATGLFRPDAGTLRVLGEPQRYANTRQAARDGIFVVHQEADLFPQLSIAENMLLGRGLITGPAGLINWPATNREAARLVANVGERFDVRAEAGGLPVARRTMAEIATAVSANARVLFLDEPTASLTTKEIDNLFAQIRRLKAAGVGIVYVSHRLDEVLVLCDRVTIMRDGATIATRETSELTMDRMVATMVGRELSALHTRRVVPTGAVRLETENLCGASGAFKNVSLSVRTGEILGLYGFVGAGRSELAQALFGLQPVSDGTVSIDGAPYRSSSPQHAVRQGLAYLPEDRLVQAVFRGHALRTNASVTVLRRLARFGLVRDRQERDLAARVITDMNVRAASIEQPIGNLSGGNQQKVIFGRWQATTPKVLILDEPTRGVDVGAKAEIHKLIHDLAERGTAIILISSELPEVCAISDRVVTLSEGRQTGVFDPKVDSEEVIAAAAVPRAKYDTTQTKAISPLRAGLARALQMRELGLVFFITLLAGGMLLMRPDSFATSANFFDILASAAIPAILAQGAMLIICAGGIDISVGSMLGLIGAVAALSAKGQLFGLPPLPGYAALTLAMGMGVACSMVNGGIALVARIHPIIVTLAGLYIYRGVMRVVTEGREVMLLPDGFRVLADGDILGIPKLCYYVIVVTLITHVFLRYTLSGRRVLALGNSETAAHLIGLSKTRLTTLVFACSGALVGLASVLQVGYYGKVQANTGTGMELQAIAAAVIGGTNILGGRGSALGTLLGAFLVALLYNSMILLDLSAYWKNLFVGGLILAAVVLDAFVQRAGRKA